MNGLSAEEGTYLAARGTATAAEILKLGRSRRYPRGATLFTEGDASDVIFVLVRGRIKICSHTDDGREVLLAVRTAGDLVGDMSALDGRPRLASASALVECEAQTIDISAFLSFLEVRPAAWLALLRVFVARQRDADEKRIEYLSHDARGRITRRLVELAERYGERDQEGIRIAIQLTQEELAGWAGSSREAVTKALRALRLHGLIETHRRSIRILDLERLKRRAV